MGTQYKELKEKDIDFISKQKVFFIASSSGKEVNLSPKGYESLRVISPDRVIILDLPGSGNRTARDIEAGGEVTIMFTSFSRDEAKILRIFGKGKIVDTSSQNFTEYLSMFKFPERHIRQIFEIEIYAVETSCGDGVPIMDFVEERSSLYDWVKKMDEKGKLKKYIEDHSQPPNLKEI
jgi:hypothetical protein